jgi:hypothetical protein
MRRGIIRTWLARISSCNWGIQWFMSSRYLNRWDGVDYRIKMIVTRVCGKGRHLRWPTWRRYLWGWRKCWWW